MKTKKAFLIITLVIVVGFTVLIGLYASMWGGFYLNNRWKFNANFKKHSVDFESVRDYVLSLYPDVNDKWVSVDKIDDNMFGLYDPDLKLFIDCPENVTEAISVLKSKEAFPNKDSKLDVIRIHKNRVSFCISNGNYSLAYSPDEKPKWVNSPTENHKVFVKKIGGGWYHVVINPD